VWEILHRAGLAGQEPRHTVHQNSVSKQMGALPRVVTDAVAWRNAKTQVFWSCPIYLRRLRDRNYREGEWPGQRSHANCWPPVNGRTHQRHGCWKVCEFPERQGNRRFSMRLRSWSMRAQADRIADPRAERDVLQPGGIGLRLLLKVPNLCLAIQPCRGWYHAWCGFRFPRHVNHFTPASLRRWCADAVHDCHFNAPTGFFLSDNM